jgi:DNA-binding response OmpR family regulator
MKTILVVGRAWKFRALLRAQLREEGYQALGFETLQDAETESSGAAALVFDTTDTQPTDWQPVLRRLQATLPAIVVSSATEELNVPAAKVLRRPLSLGDIIRVVRELTSPAR